MSDSKDDNKGLPIITPTRFGRWKFLFKAYLAERKCIKALEQPRPSIDENVFVNLLDEDGDETEESRAYLRIIRVRGRKWDRLDRQAYGYLVRACEPNASAMEVILREELDGALASDILEQLETRFSQADMTGVVQAKLAAFHSTEIDPKESTEIFVNRLLEKRRELHELGLAYVDKDVFCLGRLKESLVRDTRFQTIACTMRSTPNLTWDDAVKQLMAYEATVLPAQEKQNPVVVAKEPTEQVIKRLKEEIKVLKEKQKNSK